MCQKLRVGGLVHMGMDWICMAREYASCSVCSGLGNDGRDSVGPTHGWRQGANFLLQKRPGEPGRIHDVTADVGEDLLWIRYYPLAH